MLFLRHCQVGRSCQTERFALWPFAAFRPCTSDKINLTSWITQVPPRMGLWFRRPSDSRNPIPIPDLQVLISSPSFRSSSAVQESLCSAARPRAVTLRDTGRHRRLSRISDRGLICLRSRDKARLVAADETDVNWTGQRS